MRRSCHPLLPLVVVALVLMGCSRTESPVDSNGEITQATVLLGLSTNAGVTHEVRLIAGQRFDAGTVSCWVDDNTLFVRYETAAGWMLAETHVAVAAALDGIPRTRTGNPIVGHFPLHSTHDSPASGHTHTVDLDAWGLADLDELYVAAHAEVGLYSGGELVQEESAWGEGERFLPIAQNDRVKSKLNWATYFVLDMRVLTGLRLWNKLGSTGEVENSEVGPPGTILGDIEYLPCIYDNGFKPMERTGDPNIPTNCIDFEGLTLGPQGCIEFWYHPEWKDWSVGHCVDPLHYGVPGPYGAYRGTIQLHYNDWQDMMYFTVYEEWYVTDPPDYVSVALRPSTTPGWSTTEPFHIAITWDGTAANVYDRVKVFFNGVEVGAKSNRGSPTFVDWPAGQLLRVGTRLNEGDWYRHHWEGGHAIYDNIKVWNYPKTDFSDRFTE